MCKVAATILTYQAITHNIRTIKIFVFETWKGNYWNKAIWKILHYNSHSMVEYLQSRCKSHQNSRVFKELKQQIPSAYNSMNKNTFLNSAYYTEFSKVLTSKFGVPSYTVEGRHNLFTTTTFLADVLSIRLPQVVEGNTSSFDSSLSSLTIQCDFKSDESLEMICSSVSTAPFSSFSIVSGGNSWAVATSGSTSKSTVVINAHHIEVRAWREALVSSSILAANATTSKKITMITKQIL